MSDDAPPIGAPGSRNYPLGGKVTGPAWRAVWRLMGDGEKHPMSELLDVGMSAGGCAKATVQQIVYRAGRKGLIQRVPTLAASAEDKPKRITNLWVRL